MLACPGEGHVELAVYFPTVCHDRFGQDGELVRTADGGAEYDDVALAALITFHRVDGDVGRVGNVPFSQGFAYHGDLCAEGDDDSDLLTGTEGYARAAVQLAKGVYQTCHGFGFPLVAFG